MRIVTNWDTYETQPQKKKAWGIIMVDRVLAQHEQNLEFYRKNCINYVIMNAYNPRTWEIEARDSRIQGQLCYLESLRQA